MTQLALNYESAPSTKMLATHCAVCGRPLVDALSVEIGMGPDCRKKYGKEFEGVTNDARRVANKAVHRLAVWRHLMKANIATLDDSRAALSDIALVQQVGLSNLARTLENRLCSIRIEDRGADAMTMRTPYVDEFGRSMWRCEARWNAEEKAWSFPRARRRDVYEALRRTFPRALGLGPSGAFVIEPK